MNKNIKTELLNKDIKFTHLLDWFNLTEDIRNIANDIDTKEEDSLKAFEAYINNDLLNLNILVMKNKFNKLDNIKYKNKELLSFLKDIENKENFKEDKLKGIIFLLEELISPNSFLKSVQKNYRESFLKNINKVFIPEIIIKKSKEIKIFEIEQESNNGHYLNFWQINNIYYFFSNHIPFDYNFLSVFSSTRRDLKTKYPFIEIDKGCPHCNIKNSIIHHKSARENTKKNKGNIYICLNCKFNISGIIFPKNKNLFIFLKNKFNISLDNESRNFSETRVATLIENYSEKGYFSIIKETDRKIHYNSFFIDNDGLKLCYEIKSIIMMTKEGKEYFKYLIEVVAIENSDKVFDLYFLLEVYFQENNSILSKCGQNLFYKNKNKENEYYIHPKFKKECTGDYCCNSYLNLNFNNPIRDINKYFNPNI